MLAAPPFLRDVTGLGVAGLLAEWRWLVPLTETPLFITQLGDWVFGARNGQRSPRRA